MFRVKTLVLLAAVTFGQSLYAPAAEAGPLLDWLFRRNRNSACAPPVAPCATCQTTCQQTCSRMVVNYVPYTAYRTDWERVPVTTYQQTSSTDPCTGCTVTCNKPCTTYNWRMKQTPYTTYRPVYTQETYQVPVTYTTQVAAAPVYAPTGCSTCSSGYAAAPGYQAPAATSPYPQYYQQTPATNGTIYQPTPAAGSGATGADLQPTLNPQSLNRPVMIEGTSGSTSAYWPPTIQSQPTAAPISPLQDPNPEARWNGNQPPQLLDPFNQSTSAPSVQRWGYSPVRLASYDAADSEFVDNDVPVALRPQSREFVGSLQVETQQSQTPQPRINEGWRND